MAKTLSTKQLVALVGIGEDRLSQIEREGFIKRAARNAWSPVETLSGLVRFYRDENRRGFRSAADARVRDARAREIEVRTAERLSRYVTTEEFDTMVEQLCGIVRAELSGLPARIARRDLGLRRLVEREVDGVLNRLADEAERRAAGLDHRLGISSPGYGVHS